MGPLPCAKTRRAFAMSSLFLHFFSQTARSGGSGEGLIGRWHTLLGLHLLHRISWPPRAAAPCDGSAR